MLLRCCLVPSSKAIATQACGSQTSSPGTGLRVIIFSAFRPSATISQHSQLVLTWLAEPQHEAENTTNNLIASWCLQSWIRFGLGLSLQIQIVSFADRGWKLSEKGRGREKALFSFGVGDVAEERHQPKHRRRLGYLEKHKALSRHVQHLGAG